MLTCMSSKIANLCKYGSKELDRNLLHCVGFHGPRAQTFVRFSSDDDNVVKPNLEFKSDMA
jgi:hypothetical protein